MSVRRLTVTGQPRPSALISWFWQKKHLRLQCEKKTVPAPVLPLITGSSQACRLTSAISTVSVPRQMLRLISTGLERSALQRRGQRLQRDMMLVGIKKTPAVKPGFDCAGNFEKLPALNVSCS